MKTKDEVARELAEAHRKFEPDITRIQRITTTEEENPNEPVKLLEVNPETPPSGIVPVAFGAVNGLPYPSVVVEVTPDEYDRLKGGELTLPAGWALGETLFDG